MKTMKMIKYLFSKCIRFSNASQSYQNLMNFPKEIFVNFDPAFFTSLEIEATTSTRFS